MVIIILPQFVRCIVQFVDIGLQMLHLAVQLGVFRQEQATERNNDVPPPWLSAGEPFPQPSFSVLLDQIGSSGVAISTPSDRAAVTGPCQACVGEVAMVRKRDVTGSQDSPEPTVFDDYRPLHRPGAAPAPPRQG